MWHFRQSNNLLVFCTLVLCAGFMLQFKVLYNNHQKHLRIREIEERMTDLTENIHTVEGVANTTLMLLSTIKKALKKGNQGVKIKKTR